MGFTEAVRTCYAKKYATFSGRATRSEFWFFRLFLFLVLVAFVALFAGIGALDREPHTPFTNVGTAMLGVLAIVFILGSIIPAIAVSVRRVHDTNVTGAAVLTWYFIPYIGGLIGTIWACIPGTTGDNKYGTDPKQDVSAVFQ